MLPVWAEPVLFRKYIYTRLAPVCGRVLYYRCSGFVLTGDRLYIGKRHIPLPVVFCLQQPCERSVKLKISECRVAQSEITNVIVMSAQALKCTELHLPQPYWGFGASLKTRRPVVEMFSFFFMRNKEM